MGAGGDARVSDAAPERHWTELFAATAASRAGEPGWLEASRKAAIARFAELGIPARGHEEWKYTNAAAIAKVPWREASDVAVARDRLLATGLLDGAAPRLVFVNGRLSRELSTGAEPGVALSTFAGDPAALEPFAARDELFDDRAFAQLARALATDGAAVRIERGRAVAAPIWIVFVSAPGAAPVAAHPRFAVVAEPGSAATIHELHLGVGAGAGAHLANALGEIRVGDNAELRHVKIQLEGEGTTHLAHTALRAGRDARVRSTLVSLGARVARHDVVAVLEAEGALCELEGLYVARDGQHVDNRTTVDHRKPQGTSRELFKGVLSGRSRGVFSGKVIVRPDAQKTDAQQRNENLLLSRDAEVDSKPQLEIEADDVRCSHGTTIGQLEEEAVFYLRSRGIGETEAAALLTRGFAASILEPIAFEPLRERVLAIALERLFAGAPS
jgi:Fe-S cluster assembly protein SufD